MAHLKGASGTQGEKKTVTRPPGVPPGQSRGMSSICELKCLILRMGRDAGHCFEGMTKQLVCVDFCFEKLNG